MRFNVSLCYRRADLGRLSSLRRHWESGASWSGRSSFLIDNARSFRRTLGMRVDRMPHLSFEDFEPDHIKPRGMGGGSRDDRPKNLQPSHRWCNFYKGSKRL